MSEETEGAMPNVQQRECYLKSKGFTREFVEQRRLNKLTMPGVISSDMTEDDTKFVLTTTFPDPNEVSGGSTTGPAGPNR
jgi:hypothetical protein